MSLRFLADQCVPREITKLLQDHGCEVVPLREVLPIRAPDNDVLAKSIEMGVILLTLDGDSADVVAYPPSKYLGIVAIQLNNRPEVAPLVVQRLAAFFTTHPEPSFYRHTLLIAEPHRLRIRQDSAS